MASKLNTKYQEKKKKVKAVHQKVKLFRSNEPLLSVFMWGVNHSIQELNHVSVPVMLMSDDFKAYTKVRVDNHLFNKENMPSHFKVKEYCPLVFRNLRERFGVDENEFMNSLIKSQPTNTDSPGRSGARFLVSYDQRYVIKTCTSEEVEQMHAILKPYHEHIVERHAVTLLPQYMAMYRYTVNDTESYMIIMRNVFSKKYKIHKKYDLKGSTVARAASDKERAKDLPTYKDNDFLNDSMVISIGEEQKAKVMKTLEADVEWLNKMNLMDYSLLVGIHDCDQAVDDAEEELDGEGEENGLESDDSMGGGATGHVPTPPDSPAGLQDSFDAGMLNPDDDLFAIPSPPTSTKREIYFMALIDILTHFGAKKKTAQVVKQVKHGADAEISTVKPEQYGRRFLDFIDKCTK